MRWLAFCLALGAQAAENPLVLRPDEKRDDVWVSTNTPGIQAASEKFNRLKPVLIDPLPSSTEFKLEAITTGVVDELNTLRWPLRIGNAEPIYLEIFANRIGSSLDPVLRVVDSEGKELAYCEDDPFAGRDARLTFAPQAPGHYTLEIRDVAHGGGANFFFALKATRNIPAAPEQIPDDDEKELTLPASFVGHFNGPGDRDVFRFEARKDDRWIFASRTREEGSPCDAGLVLREAGGKLIAESIGTGADAAAITNTFANAGAYQLEVREISKLGGPGYKYWLDIRQFVPGVEVTTENDLVSGEGKIKFVARRFGYDGEIKIIADGVELEGAVIPDKKNEVEAKVKLPSEAKVLVFFAEAGGKKSLVSTEPALRKAFPLMTFPPQALDGWVILQPGPK